MQTSGSVFLSSGGVWVRTSVTNYKKVSDICRQRDARGNFIQSFEGASRGRMSVCFHSDECTCIMNICVSKKNKDVIK